MLPYNLDHVGIAVRDLDDSIARYELLYGATPLHRERIESQGVEEVMIAVGGSFVQLLEATEPDTPIGRFVAKRGEGLHHLAFAVPDIEFALAHLETEGAELVDKVPRRGSRGTRIAFFHPRTFGGTLVGLVELPR